MAHHADIVDRDHVKVTRQGFAPTLSLGLGTPTQMNFSYFFQHEDNIPDYGFPFFHGEPVRVDRGTWYGLTKDDYEKTYTNIGTISLNHQFSDALNLRSAFRYSNVRRDVEPSIPALTCVAPTTCGAGAINHRSHQKPAGTPHHGRHRGQPDRSYRAVQHLRLRAHAH